MYLVFAVYKLETFSSNPGKVHFEGFVHFLRSVGDNKTLILKYYAGIKDVTLSDLLRQTSIKTDNKLMVIYDSSWEDFPDTGRSKGEYIIFYQGGPLDHVTHIPGPVQKVSTMHNALQEWS